DRPWKRSHLVPEREAAHPVALQHLFESIEGSGRIARKQRFLDGNRPVEVGPRVEAHFGGLWPRLPGGRLRFLRGVGSRGAQSDTRHHFQKCATGQWNRRVAREDGEDLRSVWLQVEP